MKKCLVYLASFFPYEDANTVATMPLLKALSEYFDSVDIVASDKENKKGRFSVEYNGYNVYWFNNSTKFRAVAYGFLNKRILESNNHKNFFMKLKGKICKIIQKMFWVYLNDEIVIRKRLLTDDYDLLVSVTSPIVSQYCAYRVISDNKFRNIKWLPVFEDPHAAIVGNKNRVNDFKFEKKVFDLANAVIVAPDLYNDYKKQFPDFNFAKVFSMNVSTINNIIYNSNVSFDKKIKCYYAGGLGNCTIRNPKMMFDILENSKDNIVSELIINAYCSESRTALEKLCLHNERVKIYGRLSHDECLTMMMDSNILLNIGNMAYNQMPSKIFEYISSGKPIVHFSYIDNDPVVKLLENYPCKLILFDSNPDSVIKFNEFCNENYNKSFDYSQIEEIYSNFTFNSVINQCKKCLDYLC